MQNLEIDRKTKIRDERDFGPRIVKIQTEKLMFDQDYKALTELRDGLRADAHDRVALSLKKSELENCKRKHRRKQVPAFEVLFSPELFYFL